MGKKSLPLVAAAVLVAFGALGSGQDQAKDSLEQQVSALREEVRALRAELDETRALADETAAYLQRRSKSAADMSQVLSASEEAGFTFGINPRSRELLLEGWRRELSDAQKGVPGAPKPAPAETAGRERPAPRR